MSCGVSSGDERRSPYREIGPITEVVVHHYDSAFTRDTIRDRPRVDSILAIMQGGTDWTSSPPQLHGDSTFAVGLSRDGSWQGGALVGPNVIADMRRTPERDFARYRMLSAAEAGTFHRLLGRQ